jgi:hypothetical protein
MKKILLSHILILALTAVPAFGNQLWTNAAGDNDWRNPANWSGTGTSWKVSLDGTNRAIINAGDPLSLNRNVNIGDAEAGGNGELVINGGTISFERYLRIGADPGLTGTVTMTNGTINAGRALNIGQSGATGIFNFSGGTINANIDRDGDTMTVGDSDATAVLNMSGSAAINLPTGNAEIGEGDNSVTTVSISDNASLAVPNMRVGFGANSNVTLSMLGGFLNVPTGFITMGQAAGAQVTVDMSDGVINGDRVIFANEGDAALTMTGGTINAARSGSSTSSTTGGFVMGAGTSNLAVGGNAVVNVEKLYITAGGVLTISGDAAISISGSTDATNPTFDFSEAFALGDWSGVLGQIAFDGGTFTVDGQFDPVDGTLNYETLLNAAIGQGVISTNMSGMVPLAQYDAVGGFTELVLVVPEPATYALVFGVGILLLVLRRRLISSR